MEKIFSCNLQVKGKNVEYNVVFENEQYLFTTDDNDAEVKKFSLIREEDEWKAASNIEPELNKQATAALEEYLLSQH